MLEIGPNALLVHEFGAVMFLAIAVAAAIALVALVLSGLRAEP